MSSSISIIVQVYGILLRLYPGSFRREFEEQMRLDFSDMVLDASKKGGLPFVMFCLRAHLRQGQIMRVVRSAPVNYGVRGAVGFSLASFLAFMISNFIFWKLNSGDSPIAYLQVYFYDLFHTEHGLELIAWLSPALSSLLTGLVFGASLAFLFADWSGYSRYILIGMLGWFLHEEVTGILWYSGNLGFFLGSRHYFYLLVALECLSGAFLGLTFIAAKSNKKRILRLMAIGGIAYPLVTYFYVKLLFKLSLIETPWMFIALMMMVAIYWGSVLVLAVKSENKLKIPWMVIIGAIGYPLIPYVGRFIPPQLLLSFSTPTTLYPADPAFWKYMFVDAIQQAIYMIPFGLFVGFALGFQKKSIPAHTIT